MCLSGMLIVVECGNIEAVVVVLWVGRCDDGVVGFILFYFRLNEAQYATTELRYTCSNYFNYYGIGWELMICWVCVNYGLNAWAGKKKQRQRVSKMIEIEMMDYY